MAPMRALRSLQMVKGKVTESADSQLARFKSDGGRAVFRELTETCAVLWLKHPNGDQHEETFSIEDARKAGLVSSGMYAKFPKAMLRSRAITAGLKSVGWEGGSGVYDPAELSEPSAPVVQIPASIPPAVAEAVQEVSSAREPKWLTTMRALSDDDLTAKYEQAISRGDETWIARLFGELLDRGLVGSPDEDDDTEDEG